MVAAISIYVADGSDGIKPDAARVLITASSSASVALNLSLPAVSTLAPQQATGEAPGHDFTSRTALVISRPAMYRFILS